ncbi:aquaporin-like protein [Crepidotus variabilis]|uniref:Aquaporin-like protein n=1 Tax=Crepidotus variabilis TaxID=179855 RepID=A0A9P6E8M9_9AGAR|nr:aquaporin-like protein [Crepidotus variabilis]
MSTTMANNTKEHRSFKDNFLRDIKAATLEFFGTATFILLGLGAIQAGSINDGSSLERLMYYATSMGLSLLVAAWLFYRVRGGLFNPNISLALCLARVISPTRFVLYCIAQLAGAIAGAALVRALTPEPYNVNVTLNNHINKPQGVFIEMFITAALVLSVLMLAVGRHENAAFAPIGVGLTLFACHLFALTYTGASMNTARAFGPAVVSGFPYRNHWVYWLGPFLGSLLGFALFTLVKRYRKWTINHGEQATDYAYNNNGRGRSGSLTGHRSSADYRRETNGGLDHGGVTNGGMKTAV